MEILEQQIIKTLIDLFEGELKRELTMEEKLNVVINWEKFKISLDR